jgi:Uma2 family endonuclease
MQLSGLNPNKIYTYADYYSWDFEQRVELINGKIYEMFPAPSPYHQEIAGDINFELKQYMQDKLCKVYFAPFDVRLPAKDNKEIITVLQPDICVICDLTKIDKRGCLGAPDIVVEILSPGNSTKEMKLKYEVYEQAGVKEYWIVSPQNLFFFVYTLVNGQFILGPIKTVGDIVASSVLPGFTLDLTELFKNAPADGE